MSQGQLTFHGWVRFLSRKVEQASFLPPMMLTRLICICILYHHLYLDATVPGYKEWRFLGNYLRKYLAKFRQSLIILSFLPTQNPKLHRKLQSHSSERLHSCLTFGPFGRWPLIWQTPFSMRSFLTCFCSFVCVSFVCIEAFPNEVFLLQENLFPMTQTLQTHSYA